MVLHLTLLILSFIVFPNLSCLVLLMEMNAISGAQLDVALEIDAEIDTYQRVEALT